VSIEIDVSDTVFKNGALYVPLNAVLFDQNTQSLFVAEQTEGGPVARKKQVTTGKIVDKWVEIVSGLNPNDQVVFEGSRGLEGEELLTIVNTAGRSEEHT